MRPSRVLVLIGLAAAASGLYFPSVDTDGATVAALSGESVPRVWDVMENWAQITGVVLAVAIVVLAFWPQGPPIARRLAGIGIGGLTVLMAFYDRAAYRTAGRAARNLGESLDLAVLSGLLAESPGAAAGFGHFVVVGGLAVAGLGAAWEVIVGDPAAAGAELSGEGDGAPVE